MLSRFSLFISCYLVFNPVSAQGGLWLPLDAPLHVAEMRALGMEMPAEKIYRSGLTEAAAGNSLLMAPSVTNDSGTSLTPAIVDVNGSSGVLISREGLLLTAYYLLVDWLVYLSDKNTDYLTDGFWATGRTAEIPLKRYSASVVVHMEDVTAQAHVGVTEEMSKTVRQQHLKANVAAIQRIAPRAAHQQAVVKSMLGDTRYVLFVTETYQDIRLVGAPPQHVTFFGGTKDAFSWPRHNANFALLRIYTGP
ncbi:MAG: S46 family peptidase, partial [Bacteroidota bacterium]